MTEQSSLQGEIQDLWENRSQLPPKDKAARKTVYAALELLDTGKARVAEISNKGENSGEVIVNEWLKLAILLAFQLSEMETIQNIPFEYADKLPLKKNFKKLGVRVVPGASARYGSYLAPGVILMPSYVNIGAYVGENTLVDTWATVGSCAQIGKNVHLSGGVGIGGVLEPPNARPVIIGDECLIGSRCVVAEGAVVGEGSVLGAGCVLTASIPVCDVDNPEPGAEISRGEIPPWSVAIAASRKTERGATDSFYTPCILIIKHLEPGTRHDKAKLNEILRERGTGL